MTGIRTTRFATIAIGALAAMATAASAAPSAPASRYASVVIEAETGKVLYERNADLPRYPASLTKVMTLYMAFEALAAKKLALTDTIPVTAHAATRDPSRLELSPGSRLKVEDAIRGMTTKSANDAAAALAEHLGGGSEAKFAAAMTARAKALGAKRTTFRNGSGLPDEGHVTTARDLAVLCQAVVRDFPAYYHYFGLESFDYKGARFPNQNRFLNSYYGADGIKTGFINASGHNLAASAQRGGKRLIAVVMGGDTQAWTREHTTRLLDISWAKIDPTLGMVASNAEPSKAEARPAATPAATTATTTATAVAAPGTSAQGSRSETARTASPPAAQAIAVTPAPASSTPAPATVVARPQAPATALPAAPAPSAPTALAAASAPSAVPVLAAAPAPTAPAAPAADDARPGFFARLFGLAPAEASTGNAASVAAAPAAPAAGPPPVEPPVPVQVASVRREGAPAPAPATPPARREAAVRKPAAAARPAAANPPSSPSPAKAKAPTPAPEAAPAPPAAQPSDASGPQADTRPAGAEWSVQVGLYRDATVARRRGEEARMQMPPALRGADLVVARAGDGVHVVSRIARLTEADARAACSALQRGRVPCVVVPPGRPLVVATN